MPRQAKSLFGSTPRFRDFLSRRNREGNFEYNANEEAAIKPLKYTPERLNGRKV